MTILYLITKGNFGGAQRYVFELATAAQAAGHTVAVATGTSGTLTERLQAAGIRTLQVPGLVRDVSLGADLRTYRELVSLFERERPDIVHLNSSKAAGIGIVAARRAGVRRVIFTAHGWAFNEARPWWQRVVLKLIYAVIIYGSSRTICVSDAVRRDMAWLPFSTRKLALVRNGITPFDILPRDDARKRLVPETADTIWLGMLSELHPTKRIEDAIDALEHVRTTYENLALVVLGEGEQRAKLEQHARDRGVKKHVFLLGFVPDAPSYLRAFDIFLLPSRTEALSLALLEAGYASLPVVASGVGGIPEVIENHYTGLLVPPENAQDLAFSILSLLDDPDQARILGGNLHRRVLEDFMAERMVRETLALY